MTFLNETRSLEYAILNEANQRHAGFIIAFQASDRMGFSFLASGDNFVAVLHGISINQEAFKLDASSCRNIGGFADVNFVRNYLEGAAKAIGLAAPELTAAIKEDDFLWRFVGFIDGKLSTIEDNSRKWRLLWKRIQSEIVVPGCIHHASGVSSMPSMPQVHTRELEKQLNNCATEGQIVLDR